MKVIGEAQIKLFGPEDEGPHPPEKSEWWNESVWLHFCDIKSGVYGVMRIGHEPNWNGGQSGVWTMVGTPKWIYKKDGFAPLNSGDRPANGLYAHGTHRFEFDGRCHWTIDDKDFHADLVLDDYHPPLCFTPADTVLKNIARNHTEAAGRLSGSVVIKGEKYSITDALGYRDHSWGIRNWHNMRSHRWAGTNFGPDFSCNAICFFDEESNLGRFGYVRRGDTIIAASHVDVLAFMEPDGISHRGGIARYRLVNGEDIEIRCTPVNKGAIWRHHAIALNDTICHARLGNDDRVGATCFETNNNPQGGTLVPLQRSAIRVVVDNGVCPA